MSLILSNDGRSKTSAIIVCALGALLLGSEGCRSQPPAGGTASNPANGPWQVAGQPNPAGFNEMVNRQQEQARLAAEQRQALADMAAWQKQQQQQLHLMTQDKQSDHLDRLRAQAEIVANQKKELARMAELRRRSLELDANNRDLHSRLAQTQQNNRLLEDQVKLLRQQLDDSAQQIAATLKAQQTTEQRMLQVQRESQQRVAQLQEEAEQRVGALQANLQRRGSATITANNSLRRNLTAISISGLLVRQDGDVVRIEMPTDRLFDTGTANLKAQSVTLLDLVAGALRQNYGQQIIGVEAHTDNGQIQSPAWKSQHQLSAAQAMAVFDQLTQRHHFPAQQLFVLGHGPNYPVASNGTPAGQQRNRRVEIVVYPEMVGQGK